MHRATNSPSLASGGALEFPGTSADFAAGGSAINLGQTPHPEVEQAILNDVGSYGRQLGRIGDALEVFLNHVKLDDLSQAETDALSVLRGQLAAVRQVKERTLTGVSAPA